MSVLITLASGGGVCVHGPAVNTCSALIGVGPAVLEGSSLTSLAVGSSLIFHKKHFY